MNNIDIQQAGYEREGRIVGALRKEGICTHGHIIDKPELITCLGCGKTWTSREDFNEEWHEIKATYF